MVASITGALPEEYVDEAVGLLTEALNAPDEDVRALAVIALQEVGGKTPTVLTALTSALHDCNELVRKRAARALSDLEDGAISALPHLTAGLQDEYLSVQLECAAAIGRIGLDAEPALPNLFDFLLGTDIRVRTVVCTAILKLGQPALDYTLAMMDDSDSLIRERACELLGRSGCLKDPVVESLLEACTDSEFAVREAARNALERLSSIK